MFYYNNILYYYYYIIILHIFMIIIIIKLFIKFVTIFFNISIKLIIVIVISVMCEDLAKLWVFYILL